MPEHIAKSVSGYPAPSSLGSGTPTGSKFLRDDGTWQVPPSGEGGGPHATNHQNNGSDEISVAGLPGLLADAQTPLAHSHPISDVTSLQTSLDGKSSTGHTHVKADVTDFAHSHPQSEVTNLVTDLAGKAATGHTHTKADVTDFAHTHAAGDLPDLDGITAPNASVNFNGQQATGFRIENRTDDPVTPAVGQIWLRTDL